MFRGRGREVPISAQAHSAASARRQPADRTRLYSMMALNFVVLTTIGILRPARNALALDGRAEGDFYQVYLFSAAAMLFAPIFNQLGDRMRWRTVIPATALFFAASFVVFRALYSEGNTTFGLVFYGWYDLYAAAMVTQFFMVVQVFFNARDAKGAIPLVIACGSMGVVLGGVITGLFSSVVGTANLLLVAAGAVTIFAVAVRLLWNGDPPVPPVDRRGRVGERGERGVVADLRSLSANSHIRLIAGLVLVTVLVKQIVDYEFNEASKLFAGDDIDAISSFQGYVFAVKDFLPIVVLIPLGPLLRRYGVGFAVLMLPVVMLGSTVVLALFTTIGVASMARIGESMFRYSAERTSREILYVPVPTELKLRAKAYIDAGVEKGGKAVSAVLIGVCAMFMDYRNVTWVAVALSVGWCYLAWTGKRHYVTALAESIRGRFAALDGSFASLTERSTLAMVEGALRSDDAVQVGFGLDLVEQAGSVDARHLTDELELLLAHEDEEVRLRVLRLIARFRSPVDRQLIRRCLSDDSPRVAQAAVGALAAAAGSEAWVAAVLGEVLTSAEPRGRRAALSWLLSERLGSALAHGLAEGHMERLLEELPDPLDAALAAASPESKGELALASGLARGDGKGHEILVALLDDPDADVRQLAIRSAARLGTPLLADRLIDMLSDASARGPVKEALASGGADVLDRCRRRLADASEQVPVRRRVTEVLAHVPEQASVDALAAVAADLDVPWEVRYASVKALSKIRASDTAGIEFDRTSALDTACDMVAEAQPYVAVASAAADAGFPPLELLGLAAREAWADRREAAFRLLGLVFPPDDMYRCHGTLEDADDRTKANALEWLERTLGHSLFGRLHPLLDGLPSSEATAASGAVLERLSTDPDPWIEAVASRVRVGAPEEGVSPLDLIAKTFLLQKVDLLEGARSSHLGLLASIADEVEADPGEEIVRAGDPNDALYVIVKGSVELSGVVDQKLTVGEGTAFGTWSLIDSAPSVVGARATDHTRLLRITRSDFQELLSDHPELATGMLQALARRLRSLVA